MADNRRDLTRKLYDARAELEKLLKSRAEIQELLARADQRRRAEPADVRRWNSVLDGLEKSLDVTKARLAKAQYTVGQLRRELQAILGEEALAALEEAQSLPEGEDAAATFEERLEQVIGVENAAAALNDEEPEVAIRSAEGVASGPSLLESAIEKIRTHRVDALDPQEIRVTIAAHDRLTKMRNPSLKDQRLARILGAAVKVVRRKQKQK